MFKKTKIRKSIRKGELKKDDSWRADKGISREKYDMKLPPKYRQYIASANKRGIKFTLGLDEFHALCSDTCVYCGSPSTGVDRIDSDKDYTPRNVQPCCGKCNMMKYTHTSDIFINHIVKIYKHLCKKKKIVAEYG